MLLGIHCVIHLLTSLQFSCPKTQYPRNNTIQFALPDPGGKQSAVHPPRCRRRHGIFEWARRLSFVLSFQWKPRKSESLTDWLYFSVQNNTDGLQMNPPIEFENTFRSFVHISNYVFDMYARWWFLYYRGNVRACQIWPLFSTYTPHPCCI